MNGYSVIHFCRNIGQSDTMLIEIQGSIQHSFENKFTYMFLGMLYQIDDDNYRLNIGNHQILGKKVKLKNPFLLCRKSKRDSIEITGNENKITILQVIEYKIIFNSRPTPLLAGKTLDKITKK